MMSSVLLFCLTSSDLPPVIRHKATEGIGLMQDLSDKSTLLYSFHLKARWVCGVVCKVAKLSGHLAGCRFDPISLHERTSVSIARPLTRTDGSGLCNATSA